MNVDIALLPAQRKFCFSKSNHPAIIGGLGSAKTHGGIYRLILLMLDDPGINTAYYMPSYSLIKLRAIPGFEIELDKLGLKYKTNYSDSKITIENFGFIIFRSYDRPERIIAYEVAHSIVDEIDTVNKEKAKLSWRKISERNRGKCKRENTIGCVSTPDQGFGGFIYEKWGNKPQSGYELIKASTRDNIFLPEGYVQQILDNYDPLLAEMYINGDFVSLTANKVYHFFTRTKHHTQRELTPQDTVIHIGIDFNIGGCCAIVFIVENNNPIAVDEFVSHDTRDFINNLVQYKLQHRKIIVYPDASGGNESTNATASDIELIENAGYQIDCPNKNPFVRDRINSVNGLLSHDRLLINTNKCSRLTDALEMQGYDKAGKPEKFNNHPSLDDWADGLGYHLHRKYPIIKPILFTGIGSIN